MNDSPRQRLLDSFAGTRPDKPFLWESGFWAGAVERWRGEGLPPDADPFEFLGLDRLAGVSNNYLPAPPFEIVSVRDEGESELIEDESGCLIRRFKFKFHPGNPDEHAVEPLCWPVRDRGSWDFVKTRLEPLSTERMEWAEVFIDGRPNNGMERSGFSGSLDRTAGFATSIYIMSATYWLIRDLAGFENAAILLCEDPDLIDDIYAHCAWFIEEQMKVILARRVPDLVFLNEECASKSGPFMSPAMYRRYALPALSRIVDLCRGAGVGHVFIHSLGDIRHMIPMWLEIGVNGLIPLDTGAGIDPLAIRREYGHEIVLIGGINRTVLEGDRPDIEREVMSKAPELFAQGRSIPCCDAYFPITDRVSLDNMRFYVDALGRAAAM